MLLSLIKRLRSRRRSYLCAGACSVNGSLASLIFKAHLKLKKCQLYEFFCRIDFFFKFSKLFILNLKNQSGRVWTTRTKVLLHVSFFNSLPFRWPNWILTLSSCSYIDWLNLSASYYRYVRMRWLISTTVDIDNDTSMCWNFDQLLSFVQICCFFYYWLLNK